MLLHEPEKNLFLSGFIVKNPHAERKRDDSHPHGAAMNGKFGECVMIGIVQEPGNHAFLGKSQLDRIGGVEFTGCLVALSGKQFGVDLCLEIGMSGKIAFLLLVMVMRHGIDIGMACGVEQIVPQETGDVGFGNAPVCSGRETPVTFQQSAEKGTRLRGVCEGTEIVAVQGIGRKIIEKQIRSLQSERISAAVIKQIFFSGNYILTGDRFLRQTDNV